MKKRHGARWLAVVSIVASASCSISSSLDETSKQPVQLGGRWLLDRQASDDVRARLEPVIERKERRWRRDEQPYDVAPPVHSPPDVGTAGDSETARRDEMSTVRWMQLRRQREAQAIIAMLSPARQIDIQQSAREIRIASDKGEGSRTLTPGGTSSLFNSMGGFEMTSGWKDGSFVVDARGTGDNDMRTVERYTVIDDAAALELRVEVKVPDLGKHSFRFVYRRG